MICIRLHMEQLAGLSCNSFGLTPDGEDRRVREFPFLCLLSVPTGQQLSCTRITAPRLDCCGSAVPVSSELFARNGPPKTVSFRARRFGENGFFDNY
jgi:hypothetical protein